MAPFFCLALIDVCRYIYRGGCFLKEDDMAETSQAAQTMVELRQQLDAIPSSLSNSQFRAELAKRDSTAVAKLEAVRNELQSRGVALR